MAAVTVRTMWWCSPCQRRITRPQFQNPGRADEWAYHVSGGGWGHTVTAAPYIEGELVPQCEEAMAR
jgi:hypothetical protein